MNWKIEREGRRWTLEESRERWELTPEKLELFDGKLLWTDEDRIKLLGLLVENVGADAVVRLGDPAVWRAAVEAMGQQLSDPRRHG